MVPSASLCVYLFTCIAVVALSGSSGINMSNTNAEDKKEVEELEEEIDPGKIEEDAGKVMDMVKSLPAQSRRRTLNLLQPLLSSTLLEDGQAAGIADSKANKVETAHVTEGEVTLNLTGGTSKLIVQTAPPPTYHKLKVFSGATPTPPGHVDYETWKMSASKLVEDEELAEKDKLHKLRQSLAKPAIKQAEDDLNGNSSQAVLTLLDHLYGTVVDPHTLNQKFFASEQRSETASEYLNSLYLQLQEMKKVKAVTPSEVLPLLMRQFIHSCHDELVDKLQLEEKPPTDYGTLHHRVRVEEGKKIKRDLAKKKAAKCHQVQAEDGNTTPSRKGNLTSKKPQRDLEQEVEELRREVAGLRQQSTTPRPPHQVPSSMAATSGATTTPPWSRGGGRRREPRLFFCFRCGALNHKWEVCTNPANPALVMQRWEEQSKQKKQQSSN